MTLVHHILYEGVDKYRGTKTDEVEVIDSVDDSAEFEKQVFEKIGEHVVDIEGLWYGDGIGWVASYRFTNFMGRHIKVTVEVVEQSHSDPALESGEIGSD